MNGSAQAFNTHYPSFSGCSPLTTRLFTGFVRGHRARARTRS